MDDYTSPDIGHGYRTYCWKLHGNYYRRQQQQHRSNGATVTQPAYCSSCYGIRNFK